LRQARTGCRSLVGQPDRSPAGTEGATNERPASNEDLLSRARGAVRLAESEPEIVANPGDVDADPVDARSPERRDRPRCPDGIPEIDEQLDEIYVEQVYKAMIAAPIETAADAAAVLRNLHLGENQSDIACEELTTKAAAVLERGRPAT
jgi:hypothetical protein